MALDIDAGVMGVNHIGMDPAWPFGRFKQSGIGRQVGTECLDDFVEVHGIGVPGAV